MNSKVQALDDALADRPLLETRWSVTPFVCWRAWCVGVEFKPNLLIGDERNEAVCFMVGPFGVEIRRIKTRNWGHNVAHGVSSGALGSIDLAALRQLRKMSE